jgi:hypothetical protein
MDSAEAPEEFSLEDPMIFAVYLRLKIAVVRHFAEYWLTHGPFPLVVYTFSEPASGVSRPRRIRRHHLEMLIAHMRLQGEA